jgi:hypothetical protein
MVQCKLAGKAPELYPWKKPLLMEQEKGPVFVINTRRKEKADEISPPANSFNVGDWSVRVPGTEQTLSEEQVQWKPTPLVPV